MESHEALVTVVKLRENTISFRFPMLFSVSDVRGDEFKFVGIVEYSGNHSHSAAVLDTGVHGLNLELAMNAHDGMKNHGRATLHKRSVHNAKFIDEVFSSFAVIREQKNNFRKWPHFVPCCVLYRREKPQKYFE